MLASYDSNLKTILTKIDNASVDIHIIICCSKEMGCSCEGQNLRGRHEN